MPRPKGTPKTGGRKKKTENASTQIKRDLRARLETNDIDLEKHLAKAIRKNDAALIKALASLMPYLEPKLKPAEPPAPPPEKDTSEEVEALIKLLKG